MTECEKAIVKFCKDVQKEGGVDLELTLRAKDGTYNCHMIRGYDIDIHSSMNCKGDRFLHADLRTGSIESGGWKF